LFNKNIVKLFVQLLRLKSVRQIDIYLYKGSEFNAYG